MENKVFFNDCIKGMKQYPDKFFPLAVVDPPYGIDSTNLPMGTARNRKDRGQYVGVSTATKLKKNNPTDWDKSVPTDEYFEELFRVSVNQIIWGGNHFKLPPTRGIIVWDKVQSWEVFSQVEIAWTSFDIPAKLYKIAFNGGANLEPKINPNQKPVKLHDRVIKDFGIEGTTILDTHIGSGSIRQSCYKKGIGLIGFETNKQYYYDQEKRFEDFKQLYDSQHKLKL